MPKQRNGLANLISGALVVVTVGTVLGGWAAIAIDAKPEASDQYESGSESADYPEDTEQYVAAVPSPVPTAEPTRDVAPTAVPAPEATEVPIGIEPPAPAEQDDIDWDEIDEDEDWLSAPGDAPEEYEDEFEAESYPGERYGMSPIPDVIVPPSPTPTSVPTATSVPSTATAAGSGQLPTPVPAQPAPATPTQAAVLPTKAPVRPTPTRRPVRPTSVPPTPVTAPPTSAPPMATAVPPTPAPPPPTAAPPTPRPRPTIVTGSS